MRLSDAYKANELLKQSRFILGLQVAMILFLLAGVVYYGAWRFLWFIPTVYPISVLCNLIRPIYWRGFDPYIWRAAEEGRYGKMVWWNILTATLDWIFNAIPAALGAYIVCHLAERSGLHPVFGWLALSLCLYPPRPYVQVGHTFFKDFFLSSMLVGTLACAALSLFAPVTPFVVSVVAFALVVVFVPAKYALSRKNWRRDYEKWNADGAKGIRRGVGQTSGWFPRKGVIFEPQYNNYGGINQATFLEFQKSFTILRANWFGLLLSIATLTLGILGTVRVGKSLLILLAPVVVLFGLFYGSVTSCADRASVKKDTAHDPVRGYLMGLMMAPLALLTVYFGGCDLERLAAVAALFAGLWFFFFGFIVRGTSEGVFDTLEFALTLGGLGCVVASRVCFHCVWWEATLPILAFAFAYPYFRHWFPRTDIPEKQGEKCAERGVPSAESKEQIAAKKDRRDRKRERQLEALRRSQRR